MGFLRFFQTRSQPSCARTDRRGFQVEVESVAYIVCDAVGLDTSDYSFSYVARWASGDVEKIKETGERVVGCAKGMLDAFQITASSEPSGEDARLIK